MAICRDCDQEMLGASSCKVNELVMNGERLERTRVLAACAGWRSCLTMLDGRPALTIRA